MRYSKIMPKNGSFEEEYKTATSYWGDTPSTIIRNQASTLVGKTVLDIGAGDGRNALYLASLGYAVTALDLSETGLRNLTQKADAQGISDRIETVTANFVDWKPTQTFDNVITNFTFHFVGSANIDQCLEKMIALTNPGGINIYDDFTPNGPLAKTNPENYISETRLHEFYKENGWQMLHSAVKPVQTMTFETPDRPHLHEAISLVAQKPPL